MQTEQNFNTSGLKLFIINKLFINCVSLLKVFSSNTMEIEEERGCHGKERIGIDC